MKKWMTLPSHLSLTLTDAALRTIELPVLPVVLGRRGADVVLEHPSVDAEHACIEVTVEGLALRDLGSRNGTFLNGRRVGAAGVLMKADDQLTVGAVTLRVGLKSHSPKRAGAAVVDPNNLTVPVSHEAHAGDEPAPRSFLLVVTHHGRQRRFLLDRRVHTIGRMAEIRIADPALSRKHVQIELDGDAICLKDLASANGTYVGGEKISVFHGRDEIVFAAGDSTFHLIPAQRT